jgi:hypothetical protein
MTGASFKSSRVSIPGTISTNGFVWSYRTRAAIGPQNASLWTVSRASNQSAAKLPSPGSGSWRRTIERYLNTVTLVRRRFLPVSRRDMRLGFLNLLPAQVTAGACFFLSRVRLQDPGKSFGVAAVLFRPSPLLFATCHAHKKAWRWTHDVQGNTVKGA